MKLYNYDYDDMKELTFSYDTKQVVQFTSKIYPIKLEVKIDEYINRPYLYYEGIVSTNKGTMKIIFPKLDLSLDCVQYQSTPEDVRDYGLGFKFHNKIMQYRMITEFENIGEAPVMFELHYLSAEECKDIAEHFNIKTEIL